MYLSNIFSLSCFQNIHHISAQTDFSKIIIDGISIQEYPIENFVRPNEIVLSTALIVRDNPDMLYQYISDIKTANAAALFLSFPDDKSYISDRIAKLLLADSFPIFIVPWNQAFSDIISTIIEQLTSERDTLKHQLASLQKQLLTCFLHNQNIEHAATLLSQNLHCDVIITDCNEQEKAFAFYSNQLSSTTDENTNTLSMKLQTSDRLYGYIHLFNFSAPFSIIDNQVLIEQYTISPLTLWFNREWIVSSVQMQIKDTVIRKLAFQEYNNKEEIISTAKDLGFDVDCSYQAIVGKFLNHSNLSQSIWDTSSVEKKKLLTCETIIKEQVLLAANVQNLKVMTTFQSYLLIIYIEGSTYDNITNFLDLLDSYFRKTLPEFSCAYGYDLKSSTITELHYNTKNATTALNTVLNSKLSSLRSCYQISKNQRLMSLITSVPEVKLLAKEILDPVLEYDKAHSSELFHTLACFLQCNGHINEAARMLHLHRQSLLYRLNKLEDLLQVNLKSHHDIFLLDSCLQIWDWI